MVQSEIRYSTRFNITDESYSQGMVEDALLLLVAESHRIAYAIVDRQRQKAVVLRDYRLLTEPDGPEQLPEGFFQRLQEEDEILTALQPAQVVIGIHSRKHSLIPDPLFSRDHLEDTLQLTCQTSDTDRYYADAIPSASAHMIYAAPEWFLKETGDRFKEAALFHASSAFIESQLRLNKHETEPTVSILIRPYTFDLVITQGNELKFFNIFPFSTSEDLMYYLLFAMEQFQLNPDVALVRCYGDIEKVSAHWMLARKYIRNLAHGTSFETFSYSYGFDKISPHSYYGLFCQQLCVL
jgi:hypothetical protein